MKLTYFLLNSFMVILIILQYKLNQTNLRVSINKYGTKDLKII